MRPGPWGWSVLLLAGRRGRLGLARLARLGPVRRTRRRLGRRGALLPTPLASEPALAAAETAAAVSGRRHVDVDHLPVLSDLGRQRRPTRVVRLAELVVEPRVEML